MDTEVKSLANIKAMEGRNLDSSVDGNTLVSGEKADGTFGVFNFFQGIRNFFKGISALGTLASGSRLPVTDANGNVTYTTMNDINNYVVNNALTNFDKFNYATTRSRTNIDEIITNTENKTYYQLLSGDSQGTRPPSIGSAIVQTFRWDSNYSVQTAYEMDNNHSVWARYNNNGTWTSWTKVATESDLNSLLWRNSIDTLENNADLNTTYTVNAIKIYRAGYSADRQHAPSGWSGGILLSGIIGGFGFQLAFNYNLSRMNYRTYYNGTWNDWVIA